MLALHCPRHGHRVLLDTDQVVRLVNLGAGLILIEARCYDGERLLGVSGQHSVLSPDEVAHRPRRERAVGSGSPPR